MKSTKMDFDDDDDDDDDDGEEEEGEDAEDKDDNEKLSYPPWFLHEQKNEYWYYCKESNAYLLYTLPIAEAEAEAEAEATDQTDTVNRPWPLWYHHEDRSFYWYFCEEKKDYRLYPVWHYDDRRSIYWYFSEDQNACLMYDTNVAYGDPPQPDGQGRDDKPEVRYDEESVPQNFACQNVSYKSHEIQGQNHDMDGLSQEPLPSGWVEEFLIEAYLGGSWNASSTGTHHVEEDDHKESDLNAQDKLHCSQQSPLNQETPPNLLLKSTEEEDATSGFEFVSDDTPLMDEIDASEDIQSWQDQYGQVVRTNVKTESSLGAINLWYWTICIQKITNMNRDSICLVGQLAANKSTLHPSLQHRNGIIKTSQICEVNLDLVKVSSGEVYRLRQPSYKYLTSVTKYDSSNPTKDWDFPCLNLGFLKDVNSEGLDSSLKPSHDTVIAKPFSPNLNHRRFELLKRKEKAHFIPSAVRVLTKKEIASAEERKHKYRDRAKERRNAEQVHDKQNLNSATKDSFTRCPTAEHMLEKMGWSEGEGLGKKRDGMVQPLQGLSNNGRAGIGWVSSNFKHRGDN